MGHQRLSEVPQGDPGDSRRPRRALERLTDRGVPASASGAGGGTERKSGHSAAARSFFCVGLASTPSRRSEGLFTALATHRNCFVKLPRAMSQVQHVFGNVAYSAAWAAQIGSLKNLARGENPGISDVSIIRVSCALDRVVGAGAGESQCGAALRTDNSALGVRI